MWTLRVDTGELIDLFRAVRTRATLRGLVVFLVVAIVANLQPDVAVAAPAKPPAPSGPHQQQGTAAGRAHTVPATATAPTRAANAAPGSASGRVAGGNPPAVAHAPASSQASSGSRIHEAPTATMLTPGPSTTAVSRNPDGTYTARVRAQALLTNPVGTATASDSTYVRSNSNQNYSNDNALYVGQHQGFNYNTFLRFDGFGTQFANAYIVSAKLYLDTEYNGGDSSNSCSAQPVNVAAVTADWNAKTLSSFPGPATGPQIGTASYYAGVNCANGRQWQGITLNPSTLMNWAHGWAPDYGLAVTAPYTEAAWKEFNPDDAYLSIQYAADGDGAAYAETLYASPWNNKTGWANVTIQNEGSATWTPTNGYQLGYEIYTLANGVRTLYSTSNFLTPMPGTVPPNQPVTVTATLPTLTPGPVYQVCWDMTHSGQYFSGLGIPQACYSIDVVNNAPVMDSLLPYNNSTQFTLTPDLTVVAHDPDGWPGTGLTYVFNLYADGSTTPLATSGSVTAGTWTVPAGKLAWGSTYFWIAQVSDGNKTSAWSQPGYFTVPAPAQPLVTGHLGAAPQDATVNGVSPSVGNYSTAVVDFAKEGIKIGPPLEVRRTYNSLDPRAANVFGAGWSSLFDARAVPDSDGSGAVVIVLPDGREERFGLNGDGTYTAPAGSRDRVTGRNVTDTNGNAYTYYYLTDPTGLHYEFSIIGAHDAVTGQPVMPLTQVTDVDGHYLNMLYGTVTLTQPSGASRNFSVITGVQWTNTGYGDLSFTYAGGNVTTSTGTVVTVPHVTVAALNKYTYGYETDWTYGYDDANNLTSVCPPTSATACTHYSYTSGATSGSHFASMVLDSNPKAYWRLNSSAGATTVADSVAVNMGGYDAVASNVTFGQPGALAGSSQKSASFNGTSSVITLPSNLVTGNNLAVGLWFKTTQAGGTLFSYQSKPAGTAATANFTPALYIGTDGKLRGEFWDGTASPMTSAAPVNNGKWHYVVLSGAGNKETLYLDGAPSATRSGSNIAAANEPYVSVGAGQLSSPWPAVPSGNALGYFAGQIEDVSFLTRPLGLPAVQQEYGAGVLAARELVGTATPSGKTANALTYDATLDRVTTLTTADRGTYTFGTPSTSGSTGYYQSAVRGTRPAFGYPMNEPSGIVARNLLGIDTTPSVPTDGVYNNVVLGVPGIFGATGDTAGAFDGTSAYLSLPNGAVDDRTGRASAALWFRTKVAGGVLLSYQNRPIGSTPTSWTPALYVGSDGKLRGQFSDGAMSPMVSTNAVNDGTWHMVVLIGDGSTQTLWLDGQLQATRTGQTIANQSVTKGMSTVTVGAGYTAAWPSQQANNPQGYFNGQLAQVALYPDNIDKISPGVAGTLYRARGSSTGLTPTTTVSMTDPTGATGTVTMDAANGFRTQAVTNAEGAKTAYTYDTLGFQTGVTDPNGHTTTKAFDKYGSVIQQTTCQAVNSCQRMYYAYYRNTANPSDPVNGKIQYAADGRSGATGTGDPTYRTTYTYTANGHLASFTSPPTPDFPNGRTTRYTYVQPSDVSFGAPPLPVGLLTSITDPLGRVTTYQYDTGQLSQMTEPSGRVTRFQNDPYSGMLEWKTVVDGSHPNGLQTTFQYDAQNRLTDELMPTTVDAVTGRNHTAWVSLKYDDDGNITSKTVQDIGTPCPYWCNAGWPQILPGQTGLDPVRTTTYTYTQANRLSSGTDPLGLPTTYQYDAFGRTVDRTNPDGGHYHYAYSPSGNLQTTTLVGWTGDPAAPAAPTDLVLESRAYDPGGRLASVTDAMGRTTAYTYFDDNRVQSVTLAAGTPDAVVAATYTYDAAGNRISECDGWTAANGCDRVIQSTVDAANRTTKTVTDPTGMNLAVTRTFDANENILSQTLSNGTETRSATYTYDPGGNQTAISVVNGSTTLKTTKTYNQLGELTAQTDPRGYLSGAIPADYTTTYGYDDAGRRTTVSSPKVNVESNGGPAQQVVTTTLTGYNTFGEIVELDDANGNILTNTYDNGGRLVAASFPAYTAPGSTTSITPTVRYTYDAAGRVGKLTDPLGNDQVFGYDQLGHRTRATMPGGRVSSASYDPAGDVLSSTDPTGARVDRTYNALGQQVSLTEIVRGSSPQAYVTTFGYDLAGDQATVTDPLGHTTTRAYNHAGLLTGVTDPMNARTSYQYNVAGQLTKTTAPDGTATLNAYDQAGRFTSESSLDSSGTARRTTSYGYDAAGNRISVTDPLAKTVSTAYDALNRVTGESQPADVGKTISTSFGYDAVGNRTRYTDPNGNATTYTFNSLGLPESTIVPSVTGQTDAANRTSTIAYDSDGRPVTVVQPGNVTVTNGYDVAGRLVSQSGSGAEAATMTRTFAYDGDNRVVSASAPGGTETFTYDDRGLLQSSHLPAWDSSYAYDAAGRLTSRTDPGGTAVFGYDAADRLTSQSDPATGATVGFTYDPVGDLAGMTYGTGGASRTLTYDALHQVGSDVLKNPSGAVEASVTYGYDNDGRVTAKTTAGTAGSASNTYTYDQADRLVSWNNGSTSTSYAYDAAGNRVQAGNVSYAYNARSELLSSTNGSNTTSYTYTSRGTTSSVTSGSTTTAFTSDAFNQQITAGSTTYGYDALGRLVQAGGNTLTYDDLTNDVVSDGVEILNHTPTGRLLSAGSGGTGVFAFADQHGDVTATFTSTGSGLIGSRAYDPYGTVTASTGSMPNAGFQSGWTDPATSFVDAAARWYNPANADFTGPDRKQNPPVPAVNANPYAYANDNPLGNSDRSGHDACSDAEQAKAAQEYYNAHHDADLARAWREYVAGQAAAVQRAVRLAQIRQQQAAAEEAARQARLSAWISNFNAQVEASIHDALTRQVAPSQHQQNDIASSSNASQSRGGQNGQTASGDHGGSSSSVWGWVALGVAVVAVVVVAAFVLPEIFATAAVIEAGIGVAALTQSMFALAAADSVDCTAQNAPKKPVDTPGGRTVGPADADGGTLDAPEAKPDGDGDPTPRPPTTKDDEDKSRNLALGLDGYVQPFAQRHGFEHLMGFQETWMAEFLKALADPNVKFHVTLDGMKEEDYENVMERGRLYNKYGDQARRYLVGDYPPGPTAWEIYMLHVTPGALERTTFYDRHNGQDRVIPDPFVIP